MQESSDTHRELVAAVASLKSCLRSVLLATTAPARGGGCRIAGAVQRAHDAARALERLLAAVADQTLRLPLETSKRLVDVGLPELLSQLLAACQPGASWPAPAPPPPAAAAGAGAGSAAAAAATEAPAAAASVPAAQHSSWGEVQALVACVFDTLALLARVLVRACTRSSDPVMVLLQLAAPGVMEAAAAHMQQLWQLHAAACTAGAPAAAAAAAEHAAEEAAQQAAAVAAGAAGASPGAAGDLAGLALAVASFSGCYSLLAAAVDSQPGLEALHLQLSSSLCSTNFLPVAAQLLLATACPACQPASLAQPALAQHCQTASWHLLTLALHLSGAGIAISPAAPSVAVRTGQHVPSSVLAAHMRLEAAAAGASPGLPGSVAASASGAAAEAAADLPLAEMQQQLLAPPVLALLQERLCHCVAELRVRGSASGSASGSGSGSGSSAAQAAAACGGLSRLLPGRCCPEDQDVLNAALRTLRWVRALLLGASASSLPLRGECCVQLLLAVLAGALAESVRAGSSEREALRGRVIRVAVHCLQLLCAGLPAGVLAQQLPALAGALAGVVGAAGAYWDAHKRAVKSESLPYTGQVRCVDKATGDMLVRYTLAAHSSLDLLLQLLARSASPATAGLPDAEVARALLSAGLVPALEQLFRQVPAASPAHVMAAELLAELLPLCAVADASAPPPAEQLALLVTLRKFVTRAAGVPEPDRDAALAVATKLAGLLAGLAAACRADSLAHGAAAGAAAPAAAALLQHAAAQLLPALQAFSAAALKGPVPAPCGPASSCAGASASHLYHALLTAFQQLAASSRAAPQLRIADALLCSTVFSTAAGILASSFWAAPQVAAAPGACSGSGSGNGTSSGPHALHLVVLLLEDVLEPAAAAAAAAAAARAMQPPMHASCSEDCLCSVQRSEGTSAEGGCRVGNPKCGLDGFCCCAGSPKAASDITPPSTPAAAAPSRPGSSSGGLFGAALAQARQLPQHQQLLLLTSALLQSKLLPEALRAAQQLPLGAGGAAAPGVLSPRHAGGDALLGPSRSSTPRYGGAATPSSLAMAVPQRTSSSQLRDKVGGSSPPLASLLSGSLRSQPSASSQSYLSAYMGEPPALSGGSAGSLAVRLAANASARFGSATGAAGSSMSLLGSSPRSAAADDGAFGLLRAGSWASGINWAGGGPHPSLLDARLVRQSSSGFGSSTSLASPTAASCCEALLADGPAAALGASASGAALCCQLQLRLEALAMAAAQAAVDLAAAGLLGEQPLATLQATQSCASAASSSADGSGEGTEAPAAGHGLQPSSGSLSVASRGSYASYSGSGLPSPDDVLSSLRSSLAAARSARAEAPASPSLPGGGDALRLTAASRGSSASGSVATPHAAAGVAGAERSSSAEAFFPVELNQLVVSPRPLAAPSRAGLTPELLRRLMGALAAAAPLLARYAAPHEAEVCSHMLLARISPRPLGCWNAGCTNMPGASETAAASKPCRNCQLAAWCSKGCEKAAWADHTLACSRLAALASCK